MLFRKFREMTGPQRVRYIAVRGVLSVVGSFLGITAMVHSSADEALQPLTWFADVNYTDTFWSMNGDVGIAGLSITPFEGDASERISVERITVHTPGFFWLARAATAKRKSKGITVSDAGELQPSLPAMDRLGVSVEGLRFSAENYLPESFAWLGLDSAAPFEAAGCGSEDYFSTGELEDMGLPDTRQRMTMMVEAASFDVVRVSIELVTPQVSSVHIERSMRTTNAERWITLLAEGFPAGEGRHIETKLRVDDFGFVKARNRTCAKRLAITEQQFLDRHVAAVKRLALTLGAVPADSLLVAYRDYATNGGTFELLSKPMTGIPESEWAHYAPADQLKLWNLSFTRGQKTAPVEMTFTTPKPLPTDALFVSVEDSVAAPATDGAADATADPLAEEIERSLARSYGTRGAAARAKRAKPVVQPAQPVVAAVKSRSGEELSYEQLAEFVGRKVRVNTTQMLGQVATVEQFGPRSVRLRVHFTGGTATYDVPKDNLRRIVAM